MFYILLAKLTDDGLDRMNEDPELFSRTCDELDIPGTRVMARYGTIGSFDFVVMAEAREPEDLARLSVALGSAARVHIETLTAVSANLMADSNDLDRLFSSSSEDPGSDLETSR